MAVSSADYSVTSWVAMLVKLKVEMMASMMVVRSADVSASNWEKR